jgi:large subunit ribosomal protein L17
MRHRIATKRLNRDTNHRKALLKNLVRSLVETGSIVTTEAKAKETRRIADRLIHKAQTDTVAVRQLLHRTFGRRDVVNTLVDRVAPAMKDRVSGFTTLKLEGTRRGDNSDLYRLSLVTMPEKLAELGLKSGRTHEVKAKVAKPKAAAKPAAPKKAAAKATPAKKAAPAVKETKPVKAKQK